MTATREPFGPQMERVTLRRPSGLEARIITFGAALQALIVPDRDGRLDDVVLGHDGPDGYLAHRDFFGATIGRFANRIAGGRFPGGQVPPNDGPNAVHGGPEGLDRRHWQIETVEDDAVTLSTHSPDGDQGFPGNLLVRVTYALEDDALSILWQAQTDRDTPVNLTNHSFFNLGGKLQGGMRDVMGHVLQVNASRFLAVNAVSIPENPAPVEGTPFDFRQPRPLGEGIRQGVPQLLRVQGYDHCYCLDDQAAAVLHDPVTGRRMELWTDQPGLQVYSGNFLDGKRTGKGGLAPRMGDAICLEPQEWPDSPNRSDFPSPILRAGERYARQMRLRFSAQ
ncbi:aldose epimerase family protein [Falsirhodobacter deserti]|uniref:aldose epimerase family protein n=1 Tax=Falsirhodobacter deserti TaxID=1365611 RepID=UPI000FE31AC9|nr:aldose epimerase family protein [Falsirhodobacter deserti]